MENAAVKDLLVAEKKETAIVEPRPFRIGGFAAFYGGSLKY
jgi:hypothetical protein